jgi:antagonist of KipI
MIEILDAGPLTTVQDLGRFGQLRHGIPPSGPMDRRAFVLANRLAGNADGAAALECTLIGPRFRVHTQCAMAVAGADVTITIEGREATCLSTLVLDAGDTVKIGAARSGVRSYIAFSGGIDVPLVMGSRSTYVRGGLGGFEGRALRKRDRLALTPGALPERMHVESSAIESSLDESAIRVILGPQADRFTDEGIRTFLGTHYEMLPQSDRMGARLRGERIAHVRGHDIVSDAIALGSVQVAGDGQPIVLLVDRQSTGGYTKLATVCSFDIRRIAQTRPGRSLRFKAIEVEEAHRLLVSEGELPTLRRVEADQA